MKKKGIINYGTKRSDRGPGGVWLSRGPFGHGSEGGSAIGALGPVGFSINGGTRSAGYIGKTSAMSKNGTPYLGIFPRGSGGVNGRYPGGPGLLTPGGLSLGLPESKMNCPPARVITQGLQAGFIKPSVLSTRGMLETRFRYLRTGQYPNYWVQPVYPTGTQDDNASQWLYIQKKAAANICVNDTNKPEIYVGNVKCNSAGCGINECSVVSNRKSGQYRPYATIDSAGLYTKFINVAQTSSQYTLQVQRLCSNPTGKLKPFPFATNGGTGNASGSFVPPPVAQIYYDTPPAWYWNDSGLSGDTPNVEPPFI